MQNAITLGRAGYIDDELIVYIKLLTVSQKSSQPGASEHNFGATLRQYVWREIGCLVKSPKLHDHAPFQILPL